MKLRAASRQSDEQAANYIQARNQGPEADSSERRLFRANRERRPALFQAQGGEIPGRRMGRRSRRRPSEEEVSGQWLVASGQLEFQRLATNH